jgi:hypothetical protein
MAAGLGFKTFATGEVLSAANVNGYLMQGILVFATEAARDAAITAPAEGQFAFTKDNNTTWFYDGAAWVVSGATGDITAVTAGTGISGGGASGDVTVTNSMATAIDAKGDLVPGTGADTFARLAVGANNTVLTADSATATGLKWAAAAAASASFVGCRLTKSTAQSIPNATNTTLTFDTETFDTDGFHDNITNNSRITIPSGKAGKYLITCNTMINAPGSTDVASVIFKNGGTVLVINYISTANVSVPVSVISQIFSLAVADYIEIKAYQNSGSAKDVLAENYSPSTTVFSVTYLGA